MADPETGAGLTAGSRHWPAAVAIALALGFLWYRLIDHLHVEWSLNPQYHYGWAVPLLCIYLLWRRLGDYRQSGERHIRFARLEANLKALAFVAALLYAPTRLIEEANPEWRLVSWALALEVIAITLFLAGSILSSRRSGLTAIIFPVLFFLVAVPWPTVIEGPLIQALTRANAASTVEVLGWVGVPALQHGNVIEVGSGIVGIDEACSGIRSFQATLMLGLFFGELYGLRTAQRFMLCLAGFGFAFVFNVARTILLTWIAADKGSGAVESWHDPAGVAILLGCFATIWICGRAAGVKCEVRSAKCEEPKSWRRPNPSARPRLAFVFRTSPFALRVSAFVWLGWFVAVEVGTECWYWWHERHFPAGITWRIELPQNNPTVRRVPLSERTRQFLRYDEGLNAQWETDGRRWQAIFFRWRPGRTAVHLAGGHTPEVCLTAAGDRMTAQSELRNVCCGGIELPVRLYRFESDAGPLHVLYCLWRDRSPGQEFDTDRLTYWNRLSPVLTGTRLTGQRSLEIALWGCPDSQTAEADLEQQFQRLVRR